jgi:hypothetical protein
VPVGAFVPLAALSVTVAVHVVALPATTGCGSHLTIVVVGCFATLPTATSSDPAGTTTMLSDVAKPVSG